MIRQFWFLLYNGIVIPGLWIALKFGSLFNAKIRHGIAGRVNLFGQLEQQARGLRAPKRVWFHSSSMGEFEQAKPIIAALRERHRDLDIIVSFFSPSGYDHSKNYKLADLITYIPFDTVGNAKRFLDLIRPTVAVMVRYDIWPNHIRELKKRNIPILIANATMRKNSPRLKFPVRGFHEQLYSQLTSILAVSASDVKAFEKIGIRYPQVEAIGETRYDQVWVRSLEARRKHLIPESILRRRKVLVVGSSWEEDEEVIIPTFKKILQYDSNVLMILVPHEPTLPTLDRIEVQLNSSPGFIRFSDLNDYQGERIIVVDSIGILTALYQYAHVAYVGGSFKQGVHSVLEPAVYGIPVLYGPRHHNSQEAVELAKRGGGLVVH
ncbi:MAG TPA: glycosyltransferase N-terminal domain-containing protein, partial [Bacteroidota bacterium]|nr:glycosyltransferase N-terminal domain-containing protein [Bacteroidota bacterium]